MNTKLSILIICLIALAVFFIMNPELFKTTFNINFTQSSTTSIVKQLESTLDEKKENNKINANNAGLDIDEINEGVQEETKCAYNISLCDKVDSNFEINEINGCCELKKDKILSEKEQQIQRRHNLPFTDT